MKPVLSFLALAAALGAPLAALADENASPSNAPASTAISTNAAPAAANSTEKVNLVVVKGEKRSSLDGFTVPKYLTIQQQNDAYQKAYEATFGLNHTP